MNNTTFNGVKYVHFVSTLGNFSLISVKICDKKIASGNNYLVQIKRGALSPVSVRISVSFY